MTVAHMQTLYLRAMHAQNPAVRIKNCQELLREFGYDPAEAERFADAKKKIELGMREWKIRELGVVPGRTFVRFRTAVGRRKGLVEAVTPAFYLLVRGGGTLSPLEVSK